MDALVVRDRATLGVADYVIFGLTVAISSAVGIYFAVAGGRQKTTSEYLVGNRKLNILPVAVSLIVSFESSIFMLGFPAEVYAHGTQFWMVHVGLPITFILAAQMVVPLLYPLGITSAYQYFELRFQSRPVRLLASLLGITYQTFYMGIVLFGPATAMEAVTGFPVSYSVVVVAAAAVFYTSLGGIKAVVITDVIQCVIMLGGLLAVIIMGCVSVGGFTRMWQYNVDGGRVKFFDFDPNPLVRHTFWTVVVGNSIRSLALGFNQTTVQRIVSVKTQQGAKIVMLCVVPGFVVFGTMACLEGMISYAYFEHTECDPLGAKIISNTNQVLPYVVTELFRSAPGMPGLFLAALFSASLSTLSSSLSSLSAMVWTDFLKPQLKNISEFKATVIAKIIVLVFGGISVAIAFLIMLIDGPLSQISYGVLGSISGPLTGMFLAGCLFSSTNALGTMIGGLVSFAFSMWLSLGSSLSPDTRRTPYLRPAPIWNCYANGTFNTPTIGSATSSQNVTWQNESGLSNFYSISYMYFGVIGMIMSATVSVIASLVTGGRTTADKVDPRCILPIWDNLCCCLPETWRPKIRHPVHSRSRSFSSKDSTNKEEEMPLS